MLILTLIDTSIDSDVEMHNIKSLLPAGPALVASVPSTLPGGIITLQSGCGCACQGDRIATRITTGGGAAARKQG